MGVRAPSLAGGDKPKRSIGLVSPALSGHISSLGLFVTDTTKACCNDHVFEQVFEQVCFRHV